MSSRPQPRQTPSAIVRDFRHNVDGAFHLSNEEAQVSNLAQVVEEKKKVVDSEIRELEELKAKIRETEQRLERVAGSASAGAQESHKVHHQSSPSASRIPRASSGSHHASASVSSTAAPPVPSHATSTLPTSTTAEVKPGPYVPGSR